MVHAQGLIQNLAAKSIKKLLHRLGFAIRRVRKLRANFIITFHLVPSHDSVHFEEAIDSWPKSFRSFGWIS